MTRLIITVFMCGLFVVVHAQKEMLLYDGAIPNAKPVTNAEQRVMSEGEVCLLAVTQPTLTMYLPTKKKATGAAVIICPGGGYYFLAFEHEGTQVARALQQRGVTAFVLKYRLPDSVSIPMPRLAPLQDAQRAIQLVRSKASTWSIDSNRIGIMGFSAGGHLAAMAGVRADSALIPNPDGVNLRPDFMALAYPVTDLRTPNRRKVKASSRTRMLGEDSSETLIHAYSPSELVTPHTAPCFLVHAGDDSDTHVRYSLDMYRALQQHKVATMMLIYPHGEHGFGAKNTTSSVDWLDIFVQWLKDLRA